MSPALAMAASHNLYERRRTTFITRGSRAGSPSHINAYCATSAGDIGIDDVLSALRDIAQLLGDIGVLALARVVWR